MCDRRCLCQTPSSLTNEYVTLLFENEHTITKHAAYRVKGNDQKVKENETQLEWNMA